MPACSSASRSRTHSTLSARGGSERESPAGGGASVAGAPVAVEVPGTGAGAASERPSQAAPSRSAVAAASKAKRAFRVGWVMLVRRGNASPRRNEAGKRLLERALNQQLSPAIGSHVREDSKPRTIDRRLIRPLVLAMKHLGIDHAGHAIQDREREGVLGPLE